jgi:uncharacterized surface protein with fasciclin (FAS1) repeats
MFARRGLVLGSTALALAAIGKAHAQAPTRNLATLCASDSDLERFVDALRRTGLYQVIAGPGEFTVFAPTESGWGSIPLQLRNDVLPPNGPADPVRGRGLVAAHIVEGRHTAATLAGKTTTLTTMNGNRVEIDGGNPQRMTIRSTGGGGFGIGGGQAAWGSSGIVKADILGTNGVLFVVDKAILP